MKKQKFNLTKLNDIKTFSESVWLLDLKKDDEVVLEVNSPEANEKIIYVQFEILLEKMKHEFPKLFESGLPEEKNIGTKIKDYKSLASELTRITGVKFSVVEVE